MEEDLGNWASADSKPEVTQRLVDAELKEGFVFEVESLPRAKELLGDRLAVGNRGCIGARKGRQIGLRLHCLWLQSSSSIRGTSRSSTNQRPRRVLRSRRCSGSRLDALHRGRQGRAQASATTPVGVWVKPVLVWRPFIRVQSRPFWGYLGRLLVGTHRSNANEDGTPIIMPSARWINLRRRFALGFQKNGWHSDGVVDHRSAGRSRRALILE